jgi:hypothetical protein
MNSGDPRQRVPMPLLKREAVISAVLPIPLLRTRHPLRADRPLRLSSVTPEDPFGPAAHALLQRHPVAYELQPQTAAMVITMPETL